MDENLNRPTFSATKKELIAALVSYFVSYIYIACGLNFTGAGPIVFAAGYIALVEYLCAERPRAWESWVWLGCMVSSVCACVFAPCGVWGDFLTFVFAHIFAVWWTLSRAGVLLGGGSGHFLPYDALNGFVLLPFGNFFLRIRTWWSFASRTRREGKKINTSALLGSILAVLLAVVLLVSALNHLSSADAGFGTLVESVTDFFGNNINFVNFIGNFLLSILVGAYIFGLISGGTRLSAERLAEWRGQIESALGALRIVPSAVWNACLAAFIAVYAVFFVLQGGYMFGAFTRTLPENFTVAEYARRGFFELCRVMALNFVLLWLVTRMSTLPVRKRGISLALCVTLLAESILFAVIALSKLALYIDCFGFTPLRLQSTWLALVLLAGCAAALYSLITGRRSCRAWMIFGAVTLSALCWV